MKISVIFISAFVLFNVLDHQSTKYLLVDIDGDDSRLNENYGGSNVPSRDFESSPLLSPNTIEQVAASFRTGEKGEHVCKTEGRFIGWVIKNMDKVISKIFSESLDPLDIPDVKAVSAKGGKLMGLQKHTLKGTCVTTKDKTEFRKLQTTIHIPKLRVTYEISALDSTLDATVKNIEIELALLFKPSKSLELKGAHLKGLSKFEIKKEPEYMVIDDIDFKKNERSIGCENYDDSWISCIAGVLKDTLKDKAKSLASQFTKKALQTLAPKLRKIIEGLPNGNAGEKGIKDMITNQLEGKTLKQLISELT